MTIDEKIFLPQEAEFVAVQRDCALATLRPDGRPHVVPISTVLDLDRLVFATEGEAYILDGGFEFERDRTLLYEKYPQYEERAPIEEGSSVIIEVRVDKVMSSWRWAPD